MRVLFTATVVKSHINTFHLPYLKMFKDEGWETAVAARNDFESPSECVIPHCDTYFDVPFERSPFNLKNIKAFRQLKKIIDEGNYDIIHCHTPVGALLTRLAAVSARRKGTKVFYTAHGFHFYKGAPLKNWLLYYPVERLLAHLTDVLITINKEDYERAKTFKAGRIEYVPGVGIDTAKYIKQPYLCSEKRKELGVPDCAFVLLSVGELSVRKNHSVVLEALGLLKKAGTLGNIHYLICGRGPLREELEKKAEALELSDRVRFLGFRKDIGEICSTSDAFVFMSVHEGLPVALMEAMSSGVPIICSDIRGNTDLIERGVSGEIIKSDPVALADAIIRLRDDPQLCEKYVLAARKRVEACDLKNVANLMREIYGLNR